MANFAKITPLDMGVYRNVCSTGKSEAELFTACASNGASTPKYGVYFEAKARDDKYLIIIKNNDSGDGATAKDFTIKAGNHKVFGGNDLAVADLDAGDFTYVQVDSGKFLQVDDTLKTEVGVSTSVRGCIVIEGEDTDIKVCVIKMPL